MHEFKRGDKAKSKPIVKGPYVVRIGKLLYPPKWDQEFIRCSRCNSLIFIGEIYGRSENYVFCLSCMEAP